MKTKPAIIWVLVAFVLFACSKDKFKTKPTIEIQDINPTEVESPNGLLTIRLKYTDKEGDLGNGILTFLRIRTNSTPIPDYNNNNKPDTITNSIPEFPAKDRGELDINLDYNFLDEDPGRDDTMYFRITVQDAGGNQSDTIQTKAIVARKI